MKILHLINPIEDHGWHLDKLIIGNYVCIASGVIILMGGNHNHHLEWITVYPFVEQIENSYEPKGDTIIESDAWIGMNAMIMPGVTIGECAYFFAWLSVKEYCCFVGGRFVLKVQIFKRIYRPLT